MARRAINPEALRQLTAAFRQLGADDPESWARSQLGEGIPQLAIFCFTKALWEGVASEDDSAWIEQEIAWAKTRPEAPCAQIGPALEEMIAKGVTPQAIVDLVRVKQYELLFHVCSLLDGSIAVDLPINNWTIHQVDDEGNTLATIQGLHEVLLNMDPTGREMRPR